MKYYVQFMLICLFAVIGEALSTFFKLPIPGSIIGLFLLLIALQLKWIRLRHIHAVAEFLIANMTILFLPAGVGIMERWNAISANIVPIILIIMGACRACANGSADADFGCTFFHGNHHNIAYSDSSCQQCSQTYHPVSYTHLDVYKRQHVHL